MVKATANNGALIGKQLGKYEVLALLALGGTAEIYLARIGGASGFEKFVVIKCLHDHLADDREFVSMFLDEARLAAQLDHSNIVQTFELGEYNGRYYMALEFLAGMSLAMMIRRVAERTHDGRIPIPVVLTLVQQACSGLHYAHSRHNSGVALNVVHRDISPQNLVVTFEGMLKLVDFGIARAEQRETRTQAGTIKGKFAYMSPEQCISHNVDQRTDVFALGVVLFELVTGKRLFKRPNQYDTYQAVIECMVPTPSSINPELDPALDALVLRALAKDREQRYPNAEAFGDAILGYLHEHNILAGPNEVARFMDAAFAPELAEHGNRVRELLAGRRKPDDADDIDWDEEISAELLEPSMVADFTVASEVVDEDDDGGGPTMFGEAPADMIAGEIETGTDGPRGQRREARVAPPPTSPPPTSRGEKFPSSGPGLTTALSQLEQGAARTAPPGEFSPDAHSTPMATIAYDALAPYAQHSSPVAPSHDYQQQQQGYPPHAYQQQPQPYQQGYPPQQYQQQPQPYQQGYPPQEFPQQPYQQGYSDSGAFQAPAPASQAPDYAWPGGHAASPASGGWPIPPSSSTPIPVDAAWLASPAPSGQLNGVALPSGGHPQRRMPTWLLITCFALAVSLAMVLTVVVAKAIF